VFPHQFARVYNDINAYIAKTYLNLSYIIILFYNLTTNIMLILTYFIKAVY